MLSYDRSLLECPSPKLSPKNTNEKMISPTLKKFLLIGIIVIAAWMIF